MGDNSQPDKITVLVTGFGPFASHPVNASWETVKELAKIGLGEDVNLVTVEVPVIYDTVSKLVPELWKQHMPSLVVHVGVSGVARELTLEQRAHNDGYDKLDVRGLVPTSKCCCRDDDAPDCLVSRISMQKVSRAVNQSNCGVGCIVSNDPGRYLCDFIYYTSLHIDESCAAFIHVPPLDRPYSAKQLASAVRVSILSMLEQLLQLQKSSTAAAGRCLATAGVTSSHF